MADKDEAVPRAGTAADGPTTGPTGVTPVGDGRTIHERIIDVIGDLPAIGKTQKNTQQNFMFRGHDDVMNALNPLLAQHGVFFTPEVLERVVNHRTTSSNKTMYEVNLRVRYTFWGLRGDSVVASGWGEGTDLGDKATSKAMTMALKYVLGQVLALATEEISDADAGTPEPTTAAGAPPAPARRAAGQPAPPPEATDEDVDALVKLLLEEGHSMDAITKGFDVARQANGGRLTPEYVAEQTGKARERLDAATAAAEDKAPADA